MRGGCPILGGREGQMNEVVNMVSQPEVNSCGAKAKVLMVRS